MNEELITRLNAELEGKSAEEVLRYFEEVLRYFLEQYKGRIALSSSLSIEDQVLTDIIVKEAPATRIFTLDTGRLFPETYQLIDRTDMKYGIKIEVFFPDYHEVQRMVREEGINLFYNSVESRHRCCQIRKLEPLRALAPSYARTRRVGVRTETTAERDPQEHEPRGMGRHTRTHQGEPAHRMDRTAGVGLYP